MVDARSVGSQRVGRPLGNARKAIHIYSDSAYSLSPGMGPVIATHVFSANGMFDPDVTGVGHQPLGFDEMTAFFDHYTVIGSRIRIDFNGSDANQTMLVGIALVDSSTTLGSPGHYIENGSVYGQCGPNISSDGLVLNMSFSPKVFLGRSNPMSEDDLRGDSASNPVEGAFYHVWAYPYDGVDIAGGYFTLKIEYIAVWTEARRISQS